MIPLSDENPTQSRPYVTYALVAINIAVYLYQLTLGSRAEGFIAACAFVPAELVTGQDLPPPTCVHPLWLTIFTSMFMHGGLLHIASNMLFLWIFGNNVEDAMGPIKYFFFYIVGGIAALALQVAINPNEVAPTLGASGAIAAVLGGYILLYPRARVLTLIFIILFFTVVELPAIVVLGFWFATQIAFGAAGLTSPGAAGGVAYFAHIGGFIFGLATVKLLATRRRELRGPPGANPVY